MNTVAESVQDVMQVCRNGHVVTDRLHSCPERALAHCDRCGAATLNHCLTCGRELPGAIVVPGLQPMGVRQPPGYCPTCGVAFPWTARSRAPLREPLVVLEALLRRLPRVIRELRVRQGDRPPFRVADERDLEDLLRALLPLHFDDIRPECRTPGYSSVTRTDFLLAPQGIAVTVKMARPQIVDELREDAAYYQREGKCRTLVALLYDPEVTLREHPVLPSAIAESGDTLEVRCVLAAS